MDMQETDPVVTEDVDVSARAPSANPEGQTSLPAGAAPPVETGPTGSERDLEGLPRAPRPRSC